MENLESIFQKINKENYELCNHKEKLRLALTNNKYFDKNEQFSNPWNFKIAFSSISFAAIIIIGTFLITPKTIDENHTQNQTLYDRLIANTNASKISNGAGNIYAIEMQQDNVRTVLYFNNNKKLVNTIINK